MLYSTECWAMKYQHVHKMVVAEMRMLRWMCGHTRKDKIRNKDIRGKVEVVEIEGKMRENRLRAKRVDEDLERDSKKRLRWVIHPGSALTSFSLNFGVPTKPEASELLKGLVLGRDGNIHLRITPLGDVGCYNPPLLWARRPRRHIFGQGLALIPFVTSRPEPDYFPGPFHHRCEFGLDLGLKQVVIESDSHDSITSLSTSIENGSWEAYLALLHTRRLGESFQDCRWSWIPRSANMMADFLASK
ncbi:hypothetical protein DVH24_035412 [Malus domestica]|uniref:RNase H type-1 domain-containing protein n=1 Tax=Malus domestica TaxID=3750 RepID=A0A498J4V6_MALDO|nr:hypothetical protein DVH24_035412 [Malus domestica]